MTLYGFLIGYKASSRPQPVNPNRVSSMQGYSVRGDDLSVNATFEAYPVYLVKGHLVARSSAAATDTAAASFCAANRGNLRAGGRHTAIVPIATKGQLGPVVDGSDSLRLLKTEPTRGNLAHTWELVDAGITFVVTGPPNPLAYKLGDGPMPTFAVATPAPQGPADRGGPKHGHAGRTVLDSTCAEVAAPLPKPAGIEPAGQASKADSSRRLLAQGRMSYSSWDISTQVPAPVTPVVRPPNRADRRRCLQHASSQSQPVAVLRRAGVNEIREPMGPLPA